MSKAEPAVLFAALGDPTRLGLLARLADGGGRDFSKTVSHWGTGAFGPVNGRLIKRDAR